MAPANTIASAAPRSSTPSSRAAANSRVCSTSDAATAPISRRFVLGWIRTSSPAPIFRSCDAHVLPFKSAVWNGVFCSHLLQFIADLPRCLREIARCLSDGGTLIIAGGEFGTAERLKQMLGDARWSAFRSELPRPRGSHRHRTLEDYRDAATAAGFTVEARRIPFNCTAADLAEFYRVRWLPLVAPEPRAAMSTALDELMRAHGGEEIAMEEALLLCHKGSVDAGNLSGF
jgi:SAM-dependent methyltransferase